MADVRPASILRQVADAIPPACKDQFIVIGSLAAGYHFFGEQDDMQVRTKDIDSVLFPHHQAVGSSQQIAEQLLVAGWTHKKGGEYDELGGPETSTDALPLIRLWPPGRTDWFLELLSEPRPGQGAEKVFSRVVLSTGHYALVSFRFLSVATYKPTLTELGIHCARPEMMALANLLEHPEIGPEQISGPIGGRSIKRSNKDLGRVLALARLATPKVFSEWQGLWREALTELFPDKVEALLSRVSDGLDRLLASESDLEEAVHTCNNGLLASRQVTLVELRATGQQLREFVMEPTSEVSDDTPRPVTIDLMQIRLTPKRFKLPNIGEVVVNSKDNQPWPSENPAKSMAWLRTMLGAWVSSETLDSLALTDAVAELDDEDLLDACRTLVGSITRRLPDGAGAKQLVKTLQAPQRREKRLQQMLRQNDQLLKLRNAVGLEATYQEMLGKTTGANSLLRQGLLSSSQSGLLDAVHGHDQLLKLRDAVGLGSSILDSKTAGIANDLSVIYENSALIELTRLTDSVGELMSTSGLGTDALERAAGLKGHLDQLMEGPRSLNGYQATFASLSGITSVAESVLDDLNVIKLPNVASALASNLLGESQALAAILERPVAAELLDQHRWYLDALSNSVLDNFVDPIEELLDGLPFELSQDEWDPDHRQLAVVETIDATAWKQAMSPEAEQSDVEEVVRAASRYYRLLAALFEAYYEYHQLIKENLDPGQIIAPDGVQVMRQVCGLQGTVAVSEDSFGHFATHLYVLIVETTTRANMKAQTGLIRELKRYRHLLLCHNPGALPKRGQELDQRALAKYNIELIGKASPRTPEDWGDLQCALVERVIEFLKKAV